MCEKLHKTKQLPVITMDWYDADPDDEEDLSAGRNMLSDQQVSMLGQNIINVTVQPMTVALDHELIRRTELEEQTRMVDLQMRRAMMVLTGHPYKG